jgi:hypothetical protein
VVVCGYFAIVQGLSIYMMSRVNLFAVDAYNKAQGMLGLNSCTSLFFSLSLPSSLYLTFEVQWQVCDSVLLIGSLGRSSILFKA